VILVSGGYEKLKTLESPEYETEMGEIAEIAGDLADQFLPYVGGFSDD
jgi:hypothetical protein